MNKINLNFCLWCLAYAAVLSVTVVTTTFASDQTSRDIEFPTAPCSFAGEFTQQKHLQDLPQPFESTGFFFYHCDQGILWSTQSPIQETLLIKPSGKTWVIKDDNMQRLKGRQAKFISKLISQLIAADVSALQKNFAIKQLPDHFQLTPKRNAIRRALSLITVAWHESTDSTFLPITITMVDRTSQKNQIDAKPTRLFTKPSVDGILIDCTSISQLSPQHCEQLISSQ